MSETENRASQDIGQDEFHAEAIGNLYNNMKRTYDEYQQVSLKQISDAQQYDNARQNMANQALQNAIETANMVAKQTIRHADLAVDRHWNVDEQGYTAQQILASPFAEAIKAAVAAAVADSVNKKK